MTEFWTIVEFRGGKATVDFNYVPHQRGVRSYLSEGAAKGARTQMLNKQNRVGYRAGLEILHTTIHEDGEWQDGAIVTRVTTEWVNV